MLFRMDGSTFSDHAGMQPLSLELQLKPCERRKSTSLGLWPLFCSAQQINGLSRVHECAGANCPAEADGPEGCSSGTLGLANTEDENIFPGIETAHQFGDLYAQHSDQVRPRNASEWSAIRKLPNDRRSFNLHVHTTITQFLDQSLCNLVGSRFHRHS